MDNNLNLSEFENEIFNECKYSVIHELNVLSNLDDETKKKKNEDIKEMIKYYTALTQKKEEGREKIYQFSLQVLLICITAFGLFITQKSVIDSISASNFIYSIFFITLLLILLEQIFFTILIISLYYYQSSFPFSFKNLKEFGNKWKWFYYGNEEILKMSTREIFIEKKFDKTLKPYLNGLSFFIREYSHEDMDKELKNNVIQLYLLQVHNYYKNRFHLRLSTLQKYSMLGLIAIIFFGILWILITAFFFGNDPSIKICYFFKNSSFILQ